MVCLLQKMSWMIAASEMEMMPLLGCIIAGQDVEVW